MALLKEGVVPIGRTMFIPKEGGLTKDSLEIESNGQYQIVEKPDRFEIKTLNAAEASLSRSRQKNNSGRACAEARTFLV